MKSRVSMGALAIACAAMGPASEVAEAAGEQPAAETPTALPGIVRVGVAGPMRQGGVFSASLGYGFTESVLGSGDSHHRFLGTLAASYRPADWLGLAFRVDGRFDQHVSAPEGDDSGAVGDPRLSVLATQQLAPEWFGGARATVWFPGRDAPSIAFGATSLDLSLLLTHRPGSDLVLSSELGLRLDQSGAAAEGADTLSLADRLSLGVSDSNALLLGLGAVWRLGRTELLAEWSWDVLIGARSPALLESPMRISGGARWPLTGGEDLWLQVVADVSTSGRPTIDRGRPLVPVEPRLAVVGALVFRLPSGGRVEPERELDVTPLAQAGVLRGRVTGRDGAPVESGEVRYGVLSLSAPISEGAFELTELPAGQVEVIVEAKGHLSVVRTATIAPGKTTEIDVALEPSRMTGQLRGVVRSFSGKPLAAQVRVEPSGIELVAGRDGSFRVDVPPGSYTLVLKARGFATQRRAVQVEENGVTLLNVELVEGESSP